MRWGITGNNIYLRWHLLCFLLRYPQIETVSAELDRLKDEERLFDWVQAQDVIICFSESEDDISALAEAVSRSKRKAHLLTFGSRNKLPHILQQGVKGLNTSILVLPDEVFGEFAELAHSVVGAFSSALAHGEPLEVPREKIISLIYAQDVARFIYDTAHRQQCGEQVLGGREMTAGEVYDMLKRIRDAYFKNVIPRLPDGFSLNLFSAFRSYLYLMDDFYPGKLELKTDDRGSLFELVKGIAGGQTTFASTKPGKVRGNHYHARKLERFCVVKGDAEIRVRRLLTDQRWVYKVSGGDAPSFIDMPRFCTHNLINTGRDDLLTAFWTDEVYNPDDPDTYREPV